MSIISNMIAKKLFTHGTPDYLHQNQVRQKISRVRFTRQDSNLIMQELARNKYIQLDHKYAKIKRRF